MNSEWALFLDRKSSTFIPPCQKCKFNNAYCVFFLQYRDWWARQTPRWMVWQIWDATPNHLYSFHLPREENGEYCSLRLKYVKSCILNMYIFIFNLINFLHDLISLMSIPTKCRENNPFGILLQFVIFDIIMFFSFWN